MEKDAQADKPDVFQDVRDLIKEHAADVLRLVNQFGRRAVARPADGSPAGGIRGSAVSEALFDIARLSARTHEQLFKLGGRHLDSVADALFGGAGTAVHHPHRRITLRVHGPKGNIVVARFFLRNPLPEKATVRMTMLLLHAPGGRRLPAAIELRSADAPRGSEDYPVIGPCKEGRLEILIDVPPNAHPGLYKGTAYVLLNARIAGQVEVELDVTRPQPALSIGAKGKVGALLTTESFKVRNPLSESALVTISTPTHFHSNESAPAFDAPATLVPPTTLLPGQTAELQLTVTAPTVGRYDGRTVVLVGLTPVVELMVHLEVEQ
jgi:hypothetical protein